MKRRRLFRFRFQIGAAEVDHHGHDVAAVALQRRILCPRAVGNRRRSGCAGCRGRKRLRRLRIGRVKPAEQTFERVHIERCAAALRDGVGSGRIENALERAHVGTAARAEAEQQRAEPDHENQREQLEHETAAKADGTARTAI